MQSQTVAGEEEETTMDKPGEVKVESRATRGQTGRFSRKDKHNPVGESHNREPEIEGVVALVVVINLDIHCSPSSIGKSPRRHSNARYKQFQIRKAGFAAMDINLGNSPFLNGTPKGHPEPRVKTRMKQPYSSV